MVLFFRPKPGTSAEYTFEPSDEFMEQHDSEEEDVGFYLEDSEVLSIVPTGESTKYEFGGTVFPIAQGRMILRIEEWDQCEEVGEMTVHTIDHVIDEYLSSS
tara:strand:+ start:122 stop:427 length:306 start_codon:yes stop_codon:yes gene_type:complete